jgi:hypothetical protein
MVQNCKLFLLVCICTLGATQQEQQQDEKGGEHCAPAAAERSGSAAADPLAPFRPILDTSHERCHGGLHRHATTNPTTGHVAFAIGIVSAPGNVALRAAIRRTWLHPSALPADLRGVTIARFFVGQTRREQRMGIPASNASNDSSSGADSGAGNATTTAAPPPLMLSPALRAEAALHGDILAIGAEDTYAALPTKVVALFRWGALACGADYVRSLARHC